MISLESYRLQSSDLQTPVDLISNYCIQCAHYYQEVYCNDHFYKGHFCSRLGIDSDPVMKDFLLGRNYCESIRSRSESLGIFESGYVKIQSAREFSPGVLKIE